MNSVLKSLPKVELHRHLVGSIRLQTILDLAQEYKFNLPVSTLEELKPLVTISPNSGKNLGFILRKMAKFTQLCFPSRAAISRIAFEMIEDAFLDGLIYLEVRFSPVYMTAQGNLSQVDVIEAVLEGINQANQYFPVQCGVIVGINREMGKKVAKNRPSWRWLTLEKEVLWGLIWLGMRLLLPLASLKTFLSLCVRTDAWESPFMQEKGWELGVLLMPLIILVLRGLVTVFVQLKILMYSTLFNAKTLRWKRVQQVM